MERVEPRTLARFTGVLYVLEGLTSLWGHVVVPGRLIVAGDATATAANVLNNLTLFRVATAVSLAAVALLTAQTVLFYILLKPANRTGALHFASFSIVAVGLQAVCSLLALVAMLVLGGAGSQGGIPVEQQHGLALVFLRFRNETFNVFLAFFGMRSALLGFLVYRSTFLPRTIGLLMIVAGLSFTTFLWPPLGDALRPWNLAAAAPGELSLVLRLLVVGVNAQRWKERAGA